MANNGNAEGHQSVVFLLMIVWIKMDELVISPLSAQCCLHPHYRFSVDLKDVGIAGQAYVYIVVAVFISSLC